MDKKEIIKKGREVIKATDNFSQKLSIYQESYSKLRNDYSDLKSLVELNPEVNDILKQLQMIQHQKSVGMYEKLLSSLLTEVLPGYREIVLDLKTSRQMPALDVLIKKDPNNPPEDVLRGTGGSVTNIVVAGFRIISVIRSGYRRFLLLDEADCWLKEDYFPAFSKMLKEVSEKLKVQILLISHDKNSYFTGAIEHQVEIYKDNSGKINSRFNQLPDWDVEEDIVKSIRLENFQAHEDTFIPLSPTITILRGDNDLGKSSIASAFRAVFYGEGAPSDIKHFTDKSTVTVEFNKEGKFLTWERRAKSSPAETFTLYNQSYGYDSPLHKTEGLARGNVPDWLLEETGLGLFDKLDVQLTWQKEPLAFLSEGPHVRAKALAVGTDDDYVQKMMVKSKKYNSENKALVKSKETILEDQRQIIIPLKKHRIIDLYGLETTLDYLEKSDEKINNINKLIEDWESIERKSNALIKNNNIDANIVLKNNKDKIEKINNTILLWENINEKRNVLKKTKNINQDVVLKPIKSDKMFELIDLWSPLVKKVEIFYKSNNIKKLVMPENMKLKINELINLGASWSIVNKRMLILKNINKTTKISLPENNKNNLSAILLLEKEWGNLNLKTKSLSKLSHLKKIEPIKEDNNKMIDIIELGRRFKELEDLKEESFKKLSQLEEEKKSIKVLISENFPVCPTCHREWGKDHLHNLEKGV